MLVLNSIRYLCMMEDTRVQSEINHLGISIIQNRKHCFLDTPKRHKGNNKRIASRLIFGRANIISSDDAMICVDFQASAQSPIQDARLLVKGRRYVIWGGLTPFIWLQR